MIMLDLLYHSKLYSFIVSGEDCGILGYSCTIYAEQMWLLGDFQGSYNVLVNHFRYFESGGRGLKAA